MTESPDVWTGGDGPHRTAGTSGAIAGSCIDAIFHQCREIRRVSTTSPARSGQRNGGGERSNRTRRGTDHRQLDPRRGGHRAADSAGVRPHHVLSADPTSRARAFGVITWMGGVGVAAGPLIGGALLSATGLPRDGDPAGRHRCRPDGDPGRRGVLFIVWLLPYAPAMIVPAVLGLIGLVASPFISGPPDRTPAPHRRFRGLCVSGGVR